MNINDKIKQILIDKNLTPSYFADEIGVQRSSISHILSGRNRPSFDIIQKIIRRFPELGYEWIMEEESQVARPTQTGYSNINQSHIQVRQNTERHGAPQMSSTYNSPVSIRSQRNEIPPISIPQVPSTPDAPLLNESVQPVNSDKKVERILIFYTDGSFREYTPTN